MNRAVPWIVLSASLLLASAGCVRRTADPISPAAAAELTPEKFAAHVQFLAQPRLGGRVAGTAGNRIAADYLADQFRRAGLAPGGDDGTFFQAFTNDRLLVPQPGACSLVYEPPAADGSPPATQPARLLGRLGADFAPSAQGQLGAFAAPLVFAGYGVHNHIRGYNDYAALSARGAVVMILAGEPHDSTGQSKWALKGKQTDLATLPYKLKLARNQGAVAALIVTPPALMPDPADDIDDVLGDYADALAAARPTDASPGPLPAVRITRTFANRLLAAGCPGGETRTVEQLVERIHQTGRPQSFALGGTMTGKIWLTAGRCRNIIGVLRPSGDQDDSVSRLRFRSVKPTTNPDENASRVIVIGAHYDHIPATGQLAWDVGPGVRPGAGDNASGDATVQLLARALAASPGRRCTYVFLAFDSEEIGFSGSRYYVKHPLFGLDRIAVMVNIDEVGYVGSTVFSGLTILGSTLSPPLGRAIGAASGRSPLRVTALPITSTRRWSDQAAFARAGVPTLFFYNGLTAVHHTRQDTADRINPEGGAATARLIYGILQTLDGR